MSIETDLNLNYVSPTKLLVWLRKRTYESAQIYFGNLMLKQSEVLRTNFQENDFANITVHEIPLFADIMSFRGFEKIKKVGKIHIVKGFYEFNNSYELISLILNYTTDSIKNSFKLPPLEAKILVDNQNNELFLNRTDHRRVIGNLGWRSITEHDFPEYVHFLQNDVFHKIYNHSNKKIQNYFEGKENNILSYVLDLIK